VGVVGATLAAGYATAAVPRVMFLIAGVEVVAILTVAPVWVFVGVALLVRNVADALAGHTVVGTLNPGALVGVLVVCVVALRVLGMRRPIGVAVALGWSALILAWAAVAHVNFGADPSLERDFIRVLSIIGLVLLAANAVRGRSDVDRIVDVVIVASLIPAFAVLMQVADGVVRPNGTLSHANHAAGVFVIALALSLWRLLDSGYRRRYLVAALMLGAALVATRSIGGMAQALATLLAFAFLAKWSNSRRLLVAVAALALVSVFSLTAGQSRLEGLSTTKSFSQAAQGESTNSFDWRFGNWHTLLDAWREKPLIGHGSGTTNSLVTPQDALPHSEVMRLLVETGIVGLFVFGTAVFALLIALLRTTRASPPVASYGVVAVSIVMGALVHSLADNVWSQTAGMYGLAVVIGCALGLLRSERDVAAAARTAPRAVV
jgi:O-antigen ligase